MQPPLPQQLKLCDFSGKTLMIQASTLKVSCYFFSIYLSISFEYASSDYHYVWNYSIISTFIRGVNCQHFCFSCNLSVFGSQFNLHTFWNCVNFFGQEGHLLLKAKGALIHLYTCEFTCKKKSIFI